MTSVGRPMITVFAAMIGLLLSTQASADVDCGGIPTFISTDSGGNMEANWGYGAVALCNINTASTGTPGQTALTPDGCKALYTMLVTAQTTGKSFYLHFSGISSCSAIIASDGWPVAPYPYWWITN